MHVVYSTGFYGYLASLSKSSLALRIQVYDAGEVFGVMQVEQDDEDEEGKKAYPSVEITCKVIVTRGTGMQASDPTR